MIRASLSTGARLGAPLAAVALALAACTGGGGATPSASAPSAAPTAGASAGAAGDQVTTAQDAKLGTYLAGAGGRALYVLTKDSKDKPTCAGQCAKTWPPFEVAAGGSVSAASGVTGTLATVKRSDDGQDQVTYNGAPLYYFAADAAAGDVKGQGYGGVWFLAAPGTTASGGQITGAVGEAGGASGGGASAAPASPAASPASSGASGSGGGYGGGGGYNIGNGGGTGGNGGAGSGAVVSASMVNFAFVPAKITVAAGGTVTWTNTDQVAHTVTADNGSFGSGQIAPGATFSRTFTRPGTYAFHCSIHPSMTGTITVTP